MSRICIQGYEGSFHYEAAHIFFGQETETKPCATFRELVKRSSDPQYSDGGIMAIENSIAGSILPNYNLLINSGLHIIGEVYLHIKQHLLANDGITEQDIQEVHSHPMALLQCMQYLETKPGWKLVETEDTALSARNVKQHRSKHIAAIAGQAAAKLYGLQILQEDIHTLTRNYTRFLAVKPVGPADISAADKASINFITDHTRGSLMRVLQAISEGGINLSKLQSMPIPGTTFRYSFHADLEFDTIQDFNNVMKELNKHTEETRVLGIYKKDILKINT